MRTAQEWGGVLAAQAKIFLSGGEELEDLREWMSGHPGVVVHAVPHAPTPNAQGSGWDFLSVLFAEGGAVAAGVKALQLWITSRITTVKAEVGEAKFEITGRTALEDIPKLADALISALESGKTHRVDSA